jgi:hypothetical protein
MLPTVFRQALRSDGTRPLRKTRRRISGSTRPSWWRSPDLSSVRPFAVLRRPTSLPLTECTMHVRKRRLDASSLFGFERLLGQAVEKISNRPHENNKRIIVSSARNNPSPLGRLRVDGDLARLRPFGDAPRRGLRIAIYALTYHRLCPIGDIIGKSSPPILGVSRIHLGCSTWSVLPQGCWERATDCPNELSAGNVGRLSDTFRTRCALGRMSAGTPLIAGAGRGDDDTLLGSTPNQVSDGCGSMSMPESAFFRSSTV